MPGFANMRAWGQSIDMGESTFFTWRKTPVAATTAGTWYDLSMAPGNPIPQYYANAPLISATLPGLEGIYHGGSVSPATKHIDRIMVLSSNTANPTRFILLDYLLYYPFVDQGTTDEQLMTNSTALPRYSDGAGVQIMAILVGAQAGGQSFTVKYTNQSGVTGRVTPSVTCNTATATGTLVTTERAVAGTAGPFIPLQGSDTGVRAIESVTMNGTDVGLMTFVLVRPIQCFMHRGADAPVEVSFINDRPGPARIYDGAYLNLICMQNASLSSVAFHGTIQTVWN